MKNQYLYALIFIIFIAVAVAATSLKTVKFNGSSMNPTYEVDDRVIVSKLFGKVNRNSLVYFQVPPAANCPPALGCTHIKRVIAIAGDTIEIKNNKVFLNGNELKEPYLEAGTQTFPGQFMLNQPVVTLKENEYFVLGDNRPHSSDSRSWGVINREHILGVAL